MTCAAHPDREATTPCERCGALMCDRCVEHAPDKWPGRCAACKQATAPAAAPQATPLPPLPTSWSFRVLAVVVLALPLLLGGLLWAVATHHEPPVEHPGPANVGAGLGQMIVTLVLFVGVVWSLLGVALFVARLPASRFVLMGLVAAMLGISLWLLAGPLLPAVVLWASGCLVLLSALFFSADLKSAMRG